LFGLSVESLYNEELDYTNFIDLDENYSSSKATTFSFTFSYVNTSHRGAV
jgi:hypothetical protein